MRRSISRVFADLAAADPDRVIVTDAAGDITASDLDRAANGFAWRLLDDGLERSDLVTIALPNDRSFVIACVAVWKAGGTPHPVSPSRTTEQRVAIARVARPAAFLGPGDVAAPRADAPPDTWADSWKAPTSSGSTGDPKVVLAAAPAVIDPTTPVADFLPMDAIQLVSGPLAHSAVFTYAMRGLMTGHRLVILPRFDASAWIDAVERHGVTWALVVPTMMHRMLRLPPDLRAAGRLESLETVLHMGAPCAPALKRAFLDWLGPERVVEVYAGSESNGLTMIRGDEWLAHPGSVGRPIGGTEIAVRREDGRLADVGEIGQVWMRRGREPAYRYLGADSSRDAEGWDTLRDRGRLDAEGYLHLEDRVDDLILRGGEKIAPAPIEGVLEQHPAVRGAVVCGIPDDEFGAVVAVVVDTVVAEADLRRWASEHLEHAHRPVRWMIVREPVRDDAGKTSRRSWAAKFAEVDTPSR